MKQLRYISVFEHETLRTYENDQGKFITSDQLDQLYAFNDKNGNKYFTPVRQGVKFAQYVGVIQVGRITIEVLPKTDQSNDTRKWHNILLQMLSECKKIKRESASEASLRKRENSLLDLYIEMYLDEVDKIIQSGFTKKYLRIRQQTTALKGKIIFDQHLRKNLIHKERFFTEHTIYSTDNLYNQVIKKGLEVIENLNCSSYLKDRSNALLLYFNNVSDIKPTEKTFEKLPITRNTQRYEEALYIAQLLILNYSPDIKSGTEDLLAILFDMNKLWEEYIYRMLIKTKKESDIEITFQNSKTFWQSDHVNKTIRPDLVITKGKEIFIIDTKWKVIDASYPDDGDLKQIFAYNLYWKSYHSILLYPSTKDNSPSHYGKYKEGFEKEHGCRLAFVDVLDNEGRLNKECGTQILSILYANPSQVSSKELG